MPVALALVFAVSLHPAAAPRVVNVPMPPAWAFPAQAPPSVDATSWMAWSVPADAEIGSADPDRRSPQASITKLLTAILTVENLPLEQQVQISPTAGGTPIGYVGQPVIRTGEVWLVGQLLENIMVQSDNGAATALAEAVSGSVATFVELMNERAAEIGMSDTVFVNPHGLDAEGQVSTARDLIALGREALRHPHVMDAARVKQVRFTLENRRFTVTATNRDLGIYPGLLGLKTGDTARAGQVLLSYTRTARGGIIAVVLGSTNRRQATRDVVAWASRALGPRDYLFAAAAGTHLADAFPAWYLPRLNAAAARLPTGGHATSPATPLTSDLDDRLRDLLPGILGGTG